MQQDIRFRGTRSQLMEFFKFLIRFWLREQALEQMAHRALPAQGAE